MIYKVYCDGYLLYHTRMGSLTIYNPSLELELNKTGSFSFTVHADHPYYSLIHRMKSIITVYRDDTLLFRGRVLEEKTGWYNEKTCTCESDMAFLLDSVLRPFTYTGTAAEFLSYVLTLHNAQVDENKQIQPGNVTVEGLVAYDTEEYLTTHETLQKAIFEPMGGYLQTRIVDGIAYLDYLAEITLLSPQVIEFGKNLLDLQRTHKGADIATVIIPLGAKQKDEEGKDTGQRLTIEAVNDGVDFVQDEVGVAQYGVIVKSVIFDDVTDPEMLKQRGQAQLADSVKLPDSIELTAADLAAAGYDIASFSIGTQVRVVSKPHGLDQRFIVVKLTVNPFNPAGNKLVLGGAFEGFSGALQGLANQQQQILQAVEQSVRTASEAVYNVEKNVQSSITVESDNIKSIVAETYALKDETEALISDVRVEVTQTKDSYDIEFIQFRQDLEAAANGADAEFEEIHKYIRFPDGKILLGEVGNELELQISNDRISFMQDGAEVAYFSDRKLHVTDASFMHSLQIGNFAFMPRTNGNLSWKKI